MHFVISLRSAYFDHSNEPPNPFNPIQGHTVATWFSLMLKNQGVTISEVMPEDWGWFVDATHEGQTYMVGFIAFEEDDDDEKPEIIVQIDKNRTLFQRLLGKNKLVEDDPLLSMTVEAARSIPDLTDFEISGAR